MEDTLVLDGFNVGTFESATALWNRFQQFPARLVIAERLFPDGFSGLNLAQKIRTTNLSPYVYVVLSSTSPNLDQIRDALAVGVDDYLVRPHNPFQLRSRILVGMRWLNYIDSLDSQLRAPERVLETA
jgi:DNA-binding response OmpR family regulator